MIKSFKILHFRLDIIYPVTSAFVANLPIGELYNFHGIFSRDNLIWKVFPVITTIVAAYYTVDVSVRGWQAKPSSGKSLFLSLKLFGGNLNKILKSYIIIFCSHSWHSPSKKKESTANERENIFFSLLLLLLLSEESAMQFNEMKLF